MTLVNIEEPVKKSNEPIFGIDFGTTNSLVALYKDGEIILIPDKNGNELVSSVVSYSNGDIAVGQEAESFEDAIFSIKRLLGRNLESFIKKYKFIEVKDNLSINIHGVDINVIKIASEIFKKLKDNVKSFFNIELRKAVVTVPAYFDNSSRNAVKDAAKIAGIEVVRLLSEPTAAGLFYGVDNKKEHGNYLIYDLGGGTFDISLLEFHRGIFRVIATGGNDLLGGDDFDKKIADHLLKSNNIKNLNNQELKNIIKVSKLLKEKLSNTDVVSDICNRVKLSITLKEFNKIIESDIDETIKNVYKVIKNAEKTIDQIDGVLLVGGSTRINLIQEKLIQIFGRERVFNNINPDTIVAKGAALHASYLSGANENSILLLDVLPLSLGMETIGGVVEKIILKDSPIPVEESQTFTNYADGQTSFKIHVVQGEREFVKDNRSLAEFTLTNIPPLPAGKARIEIKFKVNQDGILIVSACEKTKNIKQEIEVNPSYGLSKKQVEEMIEDSYVHVEEDIRGKKLIEIKNHAASVIDVVKLAIAENSDLLLNNESAQIDQYMNNLESALKAEDCDNIDSAIKQLEESADSFLKRRLSHLVKNMKLKIK